MVDEGKRRRILDGVGALRSNDPQLRLDWAARHHRYRLRPVLIDEEIRAFEHAYGLTLPADYRWFLQSIGNGGMGPGYGLLSLGEREPPCNLALDRPERPVAWLDVAYGGCTCIDTLCLTGRERGTVWYEDEPTRVPYPDRVGSSRRRLGFVDWYLAWLDGMRARLERDDFEFTTIVVDPRGTLHLRSRAGAWMEDWAGAEGPHDTWARVTWEELATLRGTPVDEGHPF